MCVSNIEIASRVNGDMTGIVEHGGRGESSVATIPRRTHASEGRDGADADKVDGDVHRCCVAARAVANGVGKGIVADEASVWCIEQLHTVLGYRAVGWCTPGCDG